MMPQPQQDYFARSLAYRVINETRRMQEDVQRLLWDKEPRMAEERLRAWETEIHRACHEMNQAAADTITKLQEEIYELRCRVLPASEPYTYHPYNACEGKPSEPVPTVGELYRELKVDPPPITIMEPAPDPKPVTCSCPDGKTDIFCVLHGSDAPF
jgi:recombinational DNA repair ATPase RecF